MDILTQQTMESTVFEVGISAVSDADVPQQDVQNLVQAFQGVVSAAFRQVSKLTVLSPNENDKRNHFEFFFVYLFILNFRMDCRILRLMLKREPHKPRSRLYLAQHRPRPLNLSRIRMEMVRNRMCAYLVSIKIRFRSIYQTPAQLLRHPNPQLEAAQHRSQHNRHRETATLHRIQLKGRTVKMGRIMGMFEIAIRRRTTILFTFLSISCSQQTTSTQTLAEVVQQMRTVQARMEPFIQQYYDLLQNEPTFEETVRTFEVFFVFYD